MARIKPVEAPDGEYVLYEDAKEMEDMLQAILDSGRLGPYTAEMVEGILNKEDS